MEEAEKQRFFETFKGIIQSVLGEKTRDEKWRKKLEKVRARVNFRLRCTEQDTVEVYLKVDRGDVEIELGQLEDAQLMFTADPADLMNFTNKSLSTFAALTQKNQYGERRLRIKNAWRHPRLLLLVSKLLTLE
ncbi:MAG: hypothetical protein Kow0069_22660 [Promethearchaeota archaeon]